MAKPSPMLLSRFARGIIWSLHKSWEEAVQLWTSLLTALNRKHPLAAQPCPAAPTSRPIQAPCLLSFLATYINLRGKIPAFLHEQVAGRWPVSFAFQQTMFLPFHQCFSQSFPWFTEENVIPFIAVNKLSSKLLGTQVLRLVRLSNWLESLLLPVLYEENLELIDILHLYLKLH